MMIFSEAADGIVIVGLPLFERAALFAAAGR
jgi:hypothetical protein